MSFGKADRTLVCTVGHKFIATGNFIAMSVDDGRGTIHSANFCPICFSSWAAEKWPLKVDEEAETK